MTDRLLTPDQAKKSMGNLLVPKIDEEYWWKQTKKLLKTQDEQTARILTEALKTDKGEPNDR